MKNLLTTLLVLSTLLLVSCGPSGGGGGVYYPPTDRVDAFVQLLNDQSLYDSHFYLMKHPDQTLTEDFVVVYSDDTGYVAYDIRNYISGDSWSTYSTYADYQEVYIHDVTYDPYLDEYFYTGFAYNNDLFGTYAGEFVFEEAEGKTKDLQKVGAIKEAYEVSKIAEALSAEYGLSEERGMKIAKMTSDWKKLKGSRALTDADADQFSKELLGVSIAQAEKAYKSFVEGDEAGMKDLIDVASKVNDITPEHTNELINELLK